LTSTESLADQVVERRQRGWVDLEGQACSSRQVPSMDDKFTEKDDSGHLTGLVAASDACHPRPRFGVTPGLSQCAYTPGQRGAPGRIKLRFVTPGTHGRRLTPRFDRCPAEGNGDTGDVVQKVADCVLGARCRPTEISVGDCLDESAQAIRSWAKVRHRHVNLRNWT
jgi:hypothetical protein